MCVPTRMPGDKPVDMWWNTMWITLCITLISIKLEIRQDGREGYGWYLGTLRVIHRSTRLLGALALI